VDVPETRFARTRTGSTIAYQLFGDGPVTITSVPPMAQNIEMAWEWPAIRRMLEGYGSFARFIAFDKRGTGMSDRSLDIPGLDERVDELSAVLDDAGVDRTYVMGTSEGGPMALMFAATYPDRVDGVILEGTAATLATDEQREAYARHGPSPASRERRERFVAGWGTADSIVPDLFAPSLAGDREYRRWHQRYERNAASRDALLVLLDLNGEMDARGVLHRIDCPVLMLNRIDDAMVPIELARETARLLRSHGVDVELVEQPGPDHFVYAGDVDAVLAAVERFTTGRVGERPTSWTAGTVRDAVSVLGRFEVVVDGAPVPASAWGSKRARTLLKRLVVARGRPVTRDELIDLLWPDGGDPSRLAARLSVQLSAVRRVLRGGVVADRDAIRLDLDRVAVDVEAWFADSDDAAIVEGYTGELLPDDRYEDWAGPLRDEIRDRFVAAARRLAAERGGGDAVDLWRRILTEDPYDEPAHRSLVAALTADGRLGEARRAYQAYVAAMDDLGVPAAAWDDLGRRGAGDVVT
jgi:pimeloyl-ACP methyl ester carboxylesterase/DNA-binding SARP family transcriptional activator